MKLLRLPIAILVGIVAIFCTLATAQPCDTPRETWMDALKTNGISTVAVQANFDFFSNGQLDLHIESVRYFRDSANGLLELKREASAALSNTLEGQLRTAAIQRMKRRLTEELASRRVHQGRGSYLYRLPEDPCQRPALFQDVRVFGPTPLESHPKDKRLAVVADIGAVESLGGKKRRRMNVRSDDGWLYACDEPENAPLLFHKGENVTIEDLNDRLRIRSISSIGHAAELKVVSKQRLGWL